MTTLVFVGLNYLTALLELREQVYLSHDQIGLSLVELQAGGISEAVILSTCNRLEIYGVADDAAKGLDAITGFLTCLPTAPIDDLNNHFYALHGHGVAEHLMRVASGLESLVLGETQILGQVADAFTQAQGAHTDGPTISRLFTAALHAGKRARTETAISQHSLSISHAAAALVKSHFEALTSIRILIVGAGEMAELAVCALQALGAEHLSLINRTDTKAAALAQQLGIKSFAWGNLPLALAEADVVITATAATQPIIHANQFSTVVLHDRQTPLLLIDIGVPRNIEPQIKTLPNCCLYDVDDLSAVVETHWHQRQGEVGDVERIIVEEMETFVDWLHVRAVVPLITQLRSHAEALAQSEVEQTLRRLQDLNPHEQAVLNQMAHRIVNKLLHAPTMSLKFHAADGDHYDYTHTVRELFALDEHKSA